MALTLRAKIEIAAAIAVFFIGWWCVYGWLSEHDARIKEESDVKAQQSVIDGNAAAIKTINDAIASRDEQAKQKDAAIAASAAAQKTPQQIAKWIPIQVPNLPGV